MIHFQKLHSRYDCVNDLSYKWTFFLKVQEILTLISIFYTKKKYLKRNRQRTRPTRWIWQFGIQIRQFNVMWCNGIEFTEMQIAIFRWWANGMHNEQKREEIANFNNSIITILKLNLTLLDLKFCWSWSRWRITKKFFSFLLLDDYNNDSQVKRIQDKNVNDLNLNFLSSRKWHVYLIRQYVNMSSFRVHKWNIWLI